MRLRPPPLYSPKTAAQDMVSRKSWISGLFGPISHYIAAQRLSLTAKSADFRKKSLETIFDAQNFHLCSCNSFAQALGGSVNCAWMKRIALSTWLVSITKNGIASSRQISAVVAKAYD